MDLFDLPSNPATRASSTARPSRLRAIAVLAALFVVLAACSPIGTDDIKEIQATCGIHETKCGESCVDTQTSSLHCGQCNVPCASGSSCTDGRCEEYDAQACNAATKRPGMEMCGDICADTDFSNIDCGACGHACPDGTKCNFGECTEQCSSPLKYCGQGCINPNTDKDNCGRCGNQCADDQRCEFGVCE